MRNVGPQTQKKWRPGGPPPEGWEPEGVGDPEGWGPDQEKIRASRVRRVGARRAAWGLEGWGPEGGWPKISPLPLPFSLFFSRVPAFKNTTKIQREDPREREKERKCGVGEGKKTRRSGGGGGPEGGPAEGVSGAGDPALGGSGGGNEKKSKNLSI